MEGWHSLRGSSMRDILISKCIQYILAANPTLAGYCGYSGSPVDSTKNLILDTIQARSVTKQLGMSTVRQKYHRGGRRVFFFHFQEDWVGTEFVCLLYINMQARTPSYHISQLLVVNSSCSQYTDLLTQQYSPVLPFSESSISLLVYLRFPHGWLFHFIYGDLCWLVGRT